MAIEIKRTPVLEKEAAAAFMKKVSRKKSTASTKKVKASVKAAQKILTAYKQSA